MATNRNSANDLYSTCLPSICTNFLHERNVEHMNNSWSSHFLWWNIISYSNDDIITMSYWIDLNRKDMLLFLSFPYIINSATVSYNCALCDEYVIWSCCNEEMCLWQYLKITLLEDDIARSCDSNILTIALYIVNMSSIWDSNSYCSADLVELNWSCTITDLVPYHMNSTVEIIPASLIDKIYQIRIYKSVFLF